MRARSRIVNPDRTVGLADGSRLKYASLLLTTGSSPRSIPLPGSGLDGVSTFRTVEDSRRLRGLLAAGGRNVVMIGSGWIGMELAAAASTYGNTVTVLGHEEVPLGAAIVDPRREDNAMNAALVNGEPRPLSRSVEDISFSATPYSTAT